MGLAAKSLDRGKDAAHGGVQVGHHELRVEPEHEVPRAEEGAVTTCIGRVLSRMIDAVDLDNETHLGSEQVCNEPTEHRHLPAKRDAEPPAPQRFEEPSLGRRRSVPHLGRTPNEDALPTSVGTCCE
jgi:hypothetical protein